MTKFKLLLIVLSVLLISCQFSGTSTAGQREIETHVGFDGLTAEFSKDAPPQVVFEESRFPILLKLRNNGAYDIKEKKGTITIGREKDYVTRLDQATSTKVGVFSEGSDSASFDVDGKSILNPYGEEILLQWNAKAGKLDPQSEIKQSVITATLCYPYQTILTATICIDPDTFGLRPGKKACNVKDIGFGSGQGAPVAVTRIEQQMIPHGDTSIKPQFLIFLENRGKGTPVNIFNYNDICTKPFSDTKNLWNTVRIKAFVSGNKQLICCPNAEGRCSESETNPDNMAGIIRLKDNKNFVRCVFQNKDAVPKNYDAYTSPLKVELDYGYVQSLSANFNIHKPLKY